MNLDAYQKLLRWHWDIGDRLASEQLLAGVPVVTEFPKNYFDAGQQLVQRMELMLAAITGLSPQSLSFSPSKSGLAIIVCGAKLLGASSKSTSLTFPSRLRILAVESRRYNAATTGFAPLNAQIIAAIIADNLQNFFDQGVMEVSRPQDISSDHDNWLPPEMRPKIEELDLVTWGMELHSLITLPRRPKVATPQITIAGGAATITCATGGATIDYTLDWSYPGLSAATYVTPVAVVAGQTIRAVARLTGSVDSNCNLETA